MTTTTEATDNLVQWLSSPENKEQVDAMYSKWIDKNYPTQESALGKCAEATLKMKERFPWLERVRGVVHTMGQGEQLHWWLECHLINRIVDPTAKQFTLISCWEKLPDDDPRCIYPRQKCMNCGTEFYSERNAACSEKCETELLDWLG